jgi:hypothetical protein
VDAANASEAGDGDPGTAESPLLLTGEQALMPGEGLSITPDAGR